ncbi:hypothetical protein FB45DRAFT_872337 [Roridomyces roridus]|uniref:Uncharacterized protein n=1 Tax=Roridomyces roridus TaxID=1738132 RepID=A0AAD7FDN6_9AGAR|nr:hypothetical protein FB45DRAFT_872337 [Roridomyces roridus]
MYTKFFASALLTLSLGIGALAQTRCGNPPASIESQPTAIYKGIFNVQYCCEVFDPPSDGHGCDDPRRVTGTGGGGYGYGSATRTRRLTRGSPSGAATARSHGTPAISHPCLADGYPYPRPRVRVKRGHGYGWVLGTSRVTRGHH